MQVFYTTNMEESAKILHEAHRHLVIRYVYKNDPAIRFRMNTLKGIPVYWYRPWKAYAQQFLKDWENEGGVLVDSNQIEKPASESDAYLHVECPLKLKIFNHRISRNREVTVIYKPPVWYPHEKTVHRLYPSPETVARVKSWITIRAKDPLTERDLKACEVVGCVNDGVVVATDTEIELGAKLTVTDIGLHNLRKVMFHYKFSSVRPIEQAVHVLKPTCPPMDKSMLDIWKWLDDLPALSNGDRLLNEQMIKDKWGQNTGVLRKLSHSGNIVKRDKLHIYAVDRLGPDMQKIEAAHETAVSELNEMIGYVESLERFP